MNSVLDQVTAAAWGVFWIALGASSVFFVATLLPVL